MQADASLSDAMYSAVDEQGEVRDSASDGLRCARAAYSTVERRLRALLGKSSGEITMRGGRLCVALPAGAHVRHLALLIPLHQIVLLRCCVNQALGFFTGIAETCR